MILNYIPICFKSDMTSNREKFIKDANISVYRVYCAMDNELLLREVTGSFM